jgi:glycosyltransferase involved in cell wall biosynthesis
MNLLLITQAVDDRDPVLGFFTAWIAEFSKNCERVIVICLRAGSHQLPKNVQVYSLGKERGASKFTYVATFFRLILSKRREYDAVFVHMNPIYLVLGGLVWRLLGKSIALWYTHKHVDWKLRLGVAFAHRVFSASVESFRLTTPKLRITGHGIDTALFSPGTDRRLNAQKRLITTGRVSSTKQIHAMIEIVARLPKGSAHLTIVGVPATPADRLYHQALVHEVRDKGLAESVEWVGAKSQHEIADLLRAADLYLNLSSTGSMDKGVLEAMSTGVAVFSTNEAFAESADIYIDRSRSLEERVAAIQCALDHHQLGARRAWVMRHHSLQELIPRLVRHISE